MYLNSQFTQLLVKRFRIHNHYFCIKPILTLGIDYREEPIINIEYL